MPWTTPYALSRRQHRFESGWGRQRHQLFSSITSKTSPAFLPLSVWANKKPRSRGEGLERSIRNGSVEAIAVTGDEALVTTRIRAREAVETNEEVVAKFHTELRQARERLSEAEAAIRIAALRVVNGIVTRDAAQLAELERSAAAKRLELRVVDQLLMGDKVRIGEATAAVLANPPQQPEEPAGWEVRQHLNEGRTARRRELLEKLTAGDADADL